MKEKSLPFAIGLNLLLPGAGYLYMGRWLGGILGGAVVIGMLWFSTISNVAITWVFVNAIMAIDMVMLHRKRQQAIEAKEMRTCPQCAETIKREAKVCRYCNTELSPQSA